jgi:hypothetical protein
MFTLFPSNGRKSFYGKAIVVEYDNMKILYSYDTGVAKIVDGVPELLNTQWHSQTTRNHVRSFLDYYGLGYRYDELYQGIPIVRY